MGIPIDDFVAIYWLVWCRNFVRFMSKGVRLYLWRMDWSSGKGSSPVYLSYTIWKDIFTSSLDLLVTILDMTF